MTLLEVPNPDADPHQLWLNRAEKITKLFLFGFACLFCLGLIVQNIHLGALGLSEFSALQPRLILVGLGFAIYVLLPLGIGCSALGTWTHFRRRGRGIPSSAAYAALASVAVSWLIFAALSFAFLDLPLGQVPESPTGMIGRYLLFWSAYGYGDALIHVFFYVPLLIQFRRWQLGFNLKAEDNGIRARCRRTAFWISLASGAMSFPVPYTLNVFPRLLKSVGGGSPSVVQLETELDSFEFGVAFQPGAYPVIPHGTNIIYGPLLLWHETSDYIYVSQAIDSDAITVVAIPRSKIRMMTILRAFVRVKRGHFDGLIYSPEGSPGLSSYFTAPAVTQPVLSTRPASSPTTQTVTSTMPGTAPSRK